MTNNFEPEIIPISSLTPHPRNYRKHPQDQLEHIIKSIKDNGFYKNIIIAQDNVILAGHGAVKAARQLGYTEVPAVRLDINSDEPRALKVLAGDNEIYRLGEIDDTVLADILNEVNVGIDGLLGTGFDNESLAELGFGFDGIGDEGEGKDTEPAMDRAEELRQKWGVESGQLWQMGEHRVICGDCTDKDVVDRLLDVYCLLMVTDPPYGVNYNPEWRNEAAKQGYLSYAERRTGIVNNDDRVDWSDAYCLFKGKVAYTWSPPGDHVILTGQALQSAGFQIRNQIIWSKPHFPISRGHYTYQHEPCWYGIRKGEKSHWTGDHKASTVWGISLDKNIDGGHSTQKPLECMARPIRNHEGDVYDPFLGSGTTLIACQNLNRRCRGIEIDPGYIAVTLQRFYDHTGIKPELLL